MGLWFVVRVVVDERRRAYASPRGGGPGYLLFLREGSLLAQQFDAGRMETVSEAEPGDLYYGLGFHRWLAEGMIPRAWKTFPLLRS